MFGYRGVVFFPLASAEPVLVDICKNGTSDQAGGSFDGLRERVFSGSRLLLVALTVMAQIALLSPLVRCQTGMGAVGAAGVSRRLGPSGQKFVEAAKRLLIKRLGMKYYRRYIRFEAGDAYEDRIGNAHALRNEISFAYDTPFGAGGRVPPERALRIVVTLDQKANLVRYAGPIKPYRFRLSSEEAIRKARSYGLVRVDGAEIAASSGTQKGYDLIWAVGSKDTIEQGKISGEVIYRGVFVDVDSGEIRGEYRINPLIMARGGTGRVKLGEFLTKHH